MHNGKSNCQWLSMTDVCKPMSPEVISKTWTVAQVALPSEIGRPCVRS